MALIDHIRVCNAHDPARFMPLIHEEGGHGGVIGMIRADLAARLPDLGDALVVRGGTVAIADHLREPDARTEALNAMLKPLSGDGEVPPWRGEYCDVAWRFGGPPLFRVERSHQPVLGVRGYGVHLNGFTRHGPGLDGLRMWIATRADSCPMFPSQRDNIAAGGHATGHTVQDTLAKEAREEASIPDALARQAVAAGLVSYKIALSGGIRNEVLFCYDLELPPEFEPVNTDGEVAGFELWPLARVIETIRDGMDFKFNVPLVLIDFLIRHGALTPDTEPDYESLILGLRL